MIKFCVLGSGSKGNSVWVDIDGKQMLLDAGFTYKSLRKRLAIINKSPGDIKEIFISHIHGDHWGAAMKWFEKNGVKIHTEGHFKLQHDEDTPCVGYRIEDNDHNKLVYITDTGGIPCEALQYIIDANILIIEANHDTSKLIASPYPDDLKERVFNTHLRNEQIHDLITLVAWSGLQHVVLYHLSENSNSPELAMYEAVSALKKSGCENSCRVTVAEQNTPGKMEVVI